LRLKNVVTYETRLERKEDGFGWKRMADGLLDCTYGLIRRA